MFHLLSWSLMFCFIYIFQLALISLNLWSISPPLDPNPIMFLYYIAFFRSFLLQDIKNCFQRSNFFADDYLQGLVWFNYREKTTSLTMVDDCGNKWNCITVFGTGPHHHIKLGGGWKRMVQACRLEEGVMVKVGFPHAGMTDTIYIQVNRPAIVRVWCLQCNWWSAVFRVYVFRSILMFLNFL